MHAEVKGWSGVYRIDVGLDIYSYSLSNYSLDMGLLLVASFIVFFSLFLASCLEKIKRTAVCSPLQLFGMLFRVAAFLTLVWKDRDKQK